MNPKITFGISNTCIQCDCEISVESDYWYGGICSEECRKKYRDRVRYLMNNYGLDRKQAMNGLLVRRLIREIRERIRDDRKYRSHKGPPYTHKSNN